MKAMTWKVTMALVMALGVAAPLDAQGRGNGNGRDRVESTRVDEDRDKDRDDRDVRDVRDNRDDRDDRDQRDERSVWDVISGRGDRDDDRDDRDDDRFESRRSERGNGPSFCRSGAGHPVFGWDWCRERGWDRSNSRYPVRWERRPWDDVIFSKDPSRSTLDRRTLGEVLGDVVFGRIDTRRRELGSTADYAGRWVASSAGRELWISAGGVPLARLVDRDGDRRVDGVYLAER
jgi:hypothetical protein